MGAKMMIPLNTPNGPPLWPLKGVTLDCHGKPRTKAIAIDPQRFHQ
jgi:hypothetical protein